jgi:L-asparaginase
MARVVVIFTGGTISMRVDPATRAARPELGGADILSRTPGLEAIADVEPIDWGLVPASHLQFAQVLDLARLLEANLARPEVDGAVVVQGTDVMEETAFCYDLLVPGDKPVAVVGAMRNADDPRYDGPQNLRDAVHVAASPEARGLGTLVVMHGLVLPGDDTSKTHTSADDAFASLTQGPVGHVSQDALVFDGRRDGRRRLGTIPGAAAEPIWLVTIGMAMDGTPVRLASSTPGTRGIVVQATGAGNTHPDVLAAALEAMAAGIPVALASRAAAGPVLPAYGFPGGGAQWLAAGAMPAGSLGGLKARVALALGLGAGLQGSALRSLLAG